MKKIKSTAFEQWLGSFSSASARNEITFRDYAKFSIQKNISFSNASRVANKFAKAFDNLKEIKF